MPKLYLREALGLLLKTTPILWVRLGSYALLGLGLLACAAVVGGIAWLLSQLWSVLGLVVLVVGFGGGFGLVRWASRYYFYLLKAAHTAVMTEFIVHDRRPERGQLAYGREQVQSLFKDTSIMFAVDQVLDGVVTTINRTFARGTDILPIPGLDGLQNLMRQVSTFATTYVDEAILSRAYAQREANVWAVAKDGGLGGLLYAQGWKPILANAVALTLLGYVEFVVFLVILGVPAVAVGALVPTLAVPLGVGVLLGAWMLKLAVADAYAMAATLLAYHRTTADMTPDPSWQARLEQMSDGFRELTRKAAETVRDEAPNGRKHGRGRADAEPGGEDELHPDGRRQGAEELLRGGDDRTGMGSCARRPSPGQVIALLAYSGFRVGRRRGRNRVARLEGNPNAPRTRPHLSVSPPLPFPSSP